MAFIFREKLKTKQNARKLLTALQSKDNEARILESVRITY